MISKGFDRLSTVLDARHLLCRDDH